MRKNLTMFAKAYKMETQRNFLRLLVTVFLFQMMGNAGAQTDPTGFDQTQVITGTRQLTVDNAFKISELPDFFDTRINMPEITYTLIPRKIPVEISVEPIPPAQLKVREPLVKLYKNYVKAGIGTYMTPLFDFRHNSLRSRDWIYGVHLKHFSSNKGIKNVGYSGFSDNLVELSGEKLLNKHSVSGKLDFERNVIHFYGFDPQDMDIDEDTYRQRFTRFGGEVAMKSFFRDSTKLNYQGGIKYYNLSDKYGAKENNVVLNGLFHKLIDDFYASLNFNLDYNGYSADANTPFSWMNYDSTRVSFFESQPSTAINNAILHLQPELLKQANNWKVKVGLGIYAVMGNKSTFNIYPVAEASYSFLDDLLIPYAGITGKVHRNSLRSIVEVNPFVLSAIPLGPTREQIRFYGGIRGTLSRNASFNLSATTRRMRDMILFVNDTIFSEENRFDIIYDNATILSFKGEIDYRGDKLQVGASMEYFSYSMDHEQYPWHLPPYRIELSAGYNMYDKLLLGIKVGAEGKRRAKSLRPLPDTEPEALGYSIATLDGFVDLTLSAEYRYTKRLSVFLEGSNLLADKYQRWHRYPVQRALILGGLTYSF